MVKISLILVILVIGYLDTKSAIASLTNEVDFFSDEQLLPTNVEIDYQNDENLDPGEGSGFAEDNVAQDKDIISPEDAEDAFTKEKDQSVAEEDKADDETAKEVVSSSEAIEEENHSVKSEETDEDHTGGEETKQDEEAVNVDEGELDTPLVVDEENQSVKSGELDEDHTGGEETKQEVVNVDDEEVVTSQVTEEEDHSPKSVEVEDTKTDKDENIAEDGKQEDHEETHVINSNDEDGEENEENKDQIEESIKATNNRKFEQLNAETSQQDLKPDSIDDDTINTDTDNGAGSAPGELEPPEETAPQENETDKIDNKEEQTSKIVADAYFPNERDLPAERFGNARGLGKLMPMQDAAAVLNDHEVVRSPEVQRKVEEVVRSRAGNEDKKKVEDIANEADKSEKIVDGKLEGDKELPNTGASEASSSSNTVTFVIILGLVAVVGIVGFFVHKRRKGHQRATPVPTTEDRELKEVKTHRLDDGGFDGSGQKIVSHHIPEANPLILSNQHFKGDYFNDSDKNGHLPAAQQLTSFGRTPNNATTKQKDDDIRMMDDDGEDEGAERRPLVASGTAAPSINEHAEASKVQLGMGDRVKEDEVVTVED